jgi:hypothetical protein
MLLAAAYTWQYMDRNRTPRPDSESHLLPEDKIALTHILVNRTLPMSELIGALVYNMRFQEDDEEISLLSPIPISPIDQSFLFDMKLIHATEQAQDHTDNDHPYALTKLGVFVINNAVFVTGSTNTGEMPRIEIGSLLDQLMNEAR